VKFLFHFILVLFLIFSCKNKVEQKKNLVVPDTLKNSVEAAENKDHIKKAEHVGWVELKTLDSTFVYDIRYATTNNFVHKKMYSCGKCFLRKEVAFLLLKIQKKLLQKDMRLKLFDCYRPGKVQQELWKIMPNPSYVANPRKGSMHNRGVAVDLTIVDSAGNELDMGTNFDYFGKEAYHSYTNFPEKILKNRILLKSIMQQYGFEPIKSEWWHYSFRKKSFPLAQWEWECKSRKKKDMNKK